MATQNQIPISQLPRTSAISDQSLIMVVDNGIAKVIAWSTVKNNIIGYSGSRGPASYIGSRGFAGSMGIQGFDGYVGSQGVKGDPGNPGGFTGSGGRTGYAGSGFNGYVGSQGEAGPPGGYTGSSGNLGYSGSQGPKGDIGSPGGFTGSGGFIGSQGPKGDPGSPGGFIGSQGYAGSRGIGYSGSTGAGYVGSMGFRGYTGSGGGGGGGGGVGLTSRTSVQGSTASIADQSTDNITITGFKGYALYKIATSSGAWVRIYTSAAARTADASRTKGTDPLAGVGVIAEVITQGSSQQLITPGIVGFNDDSTPGTNVYLAVTNLSGSTISITVTLTMVQLEA